MINKVSDSLTGSVLAHYDEIFVRTSELYECAFADKMLIIQFLCDDRIPQSAYESCESCDVTCPQGSDQCYIDAMQQSTDGSGICSTVWEMMEDSTDSSNTSMCACDM